MSTRLVRILAAQLCAFFSLASLAAEQLSLPASDLEAPMVSHEAISTEHQLGKELEIKAHVTDNQGVRSVTLYYRKKGQEKYKTMLMQRQGQSYIYAAILTSEVSEPGFEYYIQATDLSGNSLLHGYSFSPLEVAVTSKVEIAQEETTEELAQAKPKQNTLAKTVTGAGFYFQPEYAILYPSLSGKNNGSFTTSQIILRIGKHLLPYFALEGVIGAGVVDSEIDKQAQCDRQKFSTDSLYGLNAKAFLDLNSGFKMTGSIGLAYGSATFERERYGCGIPLSQDRFTYSGVSLSSGIGLEYDFSRHTKLSASYNLLYMGELDESDLYVSGVSIAYKYVF